MRPIIYILLLNLFGSSCVIATESHTISSEVGHEHDAAVEDAQCVHDCTEDCIKECEDAAECEVDEHDCGSVENVENPWCPPNRVCVSLNCDCEVEGCPEFCNVECTETQKFCEGGLDEAGCKLLDFCEERGEAGDPPELCPGYCPVSCESDHIKCPVPNDEDGCAEAPECIEIIPAGCTGVCPVYCEEDECTCVGTTLDDGCKEVDFCIFRPSTTVEPIEPCGCTCPVECEELEEILCPGPEQPDGCFAADVCHDRAKGIDGIYCPATSDSHGCPKTCEDDEEKCPTYEDLNGCKDELLCTTKTVDEEGQYCPEYSHCYEPCKVNELQCAGGMGDDGCKNRDDCIPLERDDDGNLCPMECPENCLEGQITCDGITTEEGCVGPDICQDVGEKQWSPIPEEVGTPCPGFCPVHECPDGEIKCPSQIEPCFGCPTEEVCRVAAKDSNGVYCELESASHNCPDYCDEAKGEVLCQSYEDETGCKPAAVCMVRVQDDNGNHCPSHSVCPLECHSSEMLCPNGDDNNGCKKADSCLPRGTNLDGNLCPILCPTVCEDNQYLCSGQLANGCSAPFECVDVVIGNGGAHCVDVCPLICVGDNEYYEEGGTDANGCPEEGTCVVPMLFSEWTNRDECVPNAPIDNWEDCGPGTQVQFQTCTDGTCTDGTCTCVQPESTRTVSCAEALTELPECPDLVCRCTNFVNENGFGQCILGDEDFGDALMCYVVQPSSCTDAVASTTDADQMRSAEACLTAEFLSVSMGCPQEEPDTPVTKELSDDLHSVRCCSENGDSCTSEPCQEDITYEAASEYCSSIGSRLCFVHELNTCCDTGCGLDHTLNWVKDGSNNCPETADFKLTDFSSRLEMENNGWTFSITDDATTTTSFSDLCDMHGTYYGWIGGSTVGTISATFTASGSATLDYGNCYTNGNVNVYLNDELLDSASASVSSKLISFNFSPGDVLMVDETGTAIIKFNSLELDCECASGYHLHDGKCYKLVTTAMNYADARANCQIDEGYDLVSLTSSEINDYFKTLIEANTWHGLEDIDVEGDWKFADGTAYSYESTEVYGWYPGEPNDSGGVQDCGYMYVESKLWDDVACTATMHSMCEGPTYS